MAADVIIASHLAKRLLHFFFLNRFSDKSFIRARMRFVLNDFKGEVKPPVLEALGNCEVNPVPWSRRDAIVAEWTAKSHGNSRSTIPPSRVRVSGDDV